MVKISSFLNRFIDFLSIVRLFFNLNRSSFFPSLILILISVLPSFLINFEILSISSISSNKNKESWVIIKANYNNPNAKALSEEINKKTSGFEFLANINTSEILLWNVNNFKSKS